MSNILCDNKNALRIVAGLLGTAIKQEAFKSSKNKQEYLLNATAMFVSGQKDFTASILQGDNALTIGTGNEELIHFLSKVSDTFLVLLIAKMIAHMGTNWYYVFIDALTLEATYKLLSMATGQLC